MFSRKELLDILNWSWDYVKKRPEVYLPMQIPASGARDYSWGDLVRAVKGSKGDSEVVRGYEKLREILTLRIIESESLELPIKTKFIEEFLADVKVGGLNEEGGGLGDMNDAELEKKMEEMGWVRAGGNNGSL